MKAYVFAILVFLAMLPVAYSGENYGNGKVDFSPLFNKTLPEEVRQLIGDARLNIYDYELMKIGSIVIVNGTVEEVNTYTLESPTHKVFVKDVGTLQKIINSDSMIKEFNRQRSLHNIRVEAQDFIGQVRLAIGTIVVSMVSLFISP